VPRCYLKRFAGGGEQVRVFPKHDPTKNFVANIINIAVEKDFYAISTEAGLSQEIEHRLAEIEGNACAAMGRIDRTSWPPSPEDRSILANFIALQITRGSTFRELQAGIIDDIMKMAGRMQAAHPEGIRGLLGDEVTDEEVEEVTATLRAGDFTVTPNKNASIIDAMHVAAELVGYTVGLRWDLIVSPVPAILTSDAPVSLWRRKHGPNDNWGVGVETADEITFPIDPNQCLLLHPSDHETDLDGVPVREAVLTLNMRTALGAYRYFFSHPPH
jgi:hypothetical protein